MYGMSKFVDLVKIGKMSVLASTRALACQILSNNIAILLKNIKGCGKHKDKVDKMVWEWI